MIIDPHSSLWESDLVMVVHDVSDEYARDRIDSEILKCLFAHPDKESILILNKIDKLKNKNSLLDIVANVTGGYLNGKTFMEQKLGQRSKYIRNSMRDLEYENLFTRTAEKLKINLKDSDKNDKKILDLFEELKTCEEFLLKNLNDIKVDNADEKDLDAEDEDEEISNSNLVDLSKRIRLENLKNDYLPDKITLTNNIENQDTELGLISSIVSQSKPSKDLPVLRRIEDISPIEFKKDLLQTTDWHLYYKKLSSLALLVRGKNHWPYFNQVFMVSAKNNDGVNDLKRYLFARAKPNKWMFSRNMLTDQMPQEIAEMCVREKMR